MVVSSRRSAIDAVQDGAVVVAVAGSALLVHTSSLDPIEIAKLTTVALCALVLLATTTANALRSGRIAIAGGWPTASAFVFAAAAVLSTVLADQPQQSLLGTYRRFSGLILYLACVVIFAVIAQRQKGDLAELLRRCVLVVAAVLAAYGVAQAIGMDPIGWQAIYGHSAFATLGNPNFLAGYLGIAFPIAAGALASALASRRPRAYILPGAAVLLLLAGILASRSSQGVVAAGAGTAFVLGVWLLTRPSGTLRTWGLAALGVATVLGVGVVGAGIAGAGPLAAFAGEAGVVARQYYWRTAISMFSTNPLTGVGLDRYGAYFRAHRPIEAALNSSLTATSDAAHNVPLHFLAGGGVILAVAYAAFVVAVGVVLVRGLKRGEHERQRRSLAALGGAWLAYHVQSAVSIDVPPLAVLHWTLAGAIVALAGTQQELFEFHVPRRWRRHSLWGPGWTAGVILLALLGAWWLITPLRADVAAGAAARAAAAGEADVAVQHAHRAASIYPAAAVYWTELGNHYLQLQQRAEALNAFERASAADPRSIEPLISAGRLTLALERPAESAAWYERAVEVEPHHPALRIEFARALNASGEASRAAELLRDVLQTAPDNAEARALLQQVEAGG